MTNKLFKAILAFCKIRNLFFIITFLGFWYKISVLLSSMTFYRMVDFFIPGYYFIFAFDKNNKLLIAFIILFPTSDMKQVFCFGFL